MNRKSAYPVDNMILTRWSPRAMSGEAITEEQLMALFEAARWAPSSYNNQPWRFIYAKRDTSEWQTMFDFLVPFNQDWAKNAAAFVVIASKDNFAYNNQPSRTHAFDTGAAWQNMALQGHKDDLVVHAMEGFDYDKAKRVLGVPDGYTIHAMVAVGKPGNKEGLPKELQEKERPSDRKPIEAFISQGRFEQS